MSIQHPSAANSSSTQSDAFGVAKTFDRDVAFVIGVNGTLGNTSTLPLELADFYARKNEDQVRLDWKTFTEENASHFVLQRSKDGDTWVDFEEITATGTTNEVQTYSTTDEKPFLGMNYYRLKMIDLDEQFRLSEVIAVNMYSKSLEIQIHPNPVEDELTIYFPIKTSDKAFIQISDLSGKVVYEETLDGIQAARHPINIEHLPSNVYLVSVKAGLLNRVMKVVKQ